jgi:hypothetical protein
MLRRFANVLILVFSLASVALADDFKTITGKEYKKVTVSRIEPDGIVIRFSGGIVKIPFTELCQELQRKYGYNPEVAKQTAQAAQQIAAQTVPDRRTTTNGVDCLDLATAEPALNSAAVSLDASVRAAKSGDRAEAALHMKKAAASLSIAATATSADADVSQFLMRAAHSYESAAAGYTHGDETEAVNYAAAGIGFVSTSTAALQKSSVPRCQ